MSNIKKFEAYFSVNENTKEQAKEQAKAQLKISNGNLLIKYGEKIAKIKVVPNEHVKNARVTSTEEDIKVDIDRDQITITTEVNGIFNRRSIC